MSSNPSFQFQKDFEVRSYQVDPDGKLSLTALSNLFQEIAWRHADSADFGRNLQEQHLSWIMARMDIKCENLPSWGDSIKVYTAGRGQDKLFAFREFLVTDFQGVVLAHAMSSWVLMNVQSKRILRPEKVLSAELFNPEEKPAWQPEKIKCEGELLKSEKLKVRYSDLDLNNHVNNTSYVRWVENILRENGCDTPRFLINYLAECVKEDELDIHLYRNESDFIVQGLVGEKLVFLATAK
ncbi:acyl-ACP thioesterase [Algoriphagus ratkowskyi]|uniref:Acyl-ACP thioesterase n=1 Tax=Algoriphagus ratkowskyi TaxID=57028 RepID=A0A2W7R575_9BACT|nr:acyl-ACP thioesterase domain-containing protein [Algoriphagus ratkowskyi]PZX55978.1 acyl-ACP thioesterase [Algoriphagus ratkowskyi]TXD77209.1 acyl-ACP thioesterase [Algoriphagus ratkowskyi]